MQHSSLKEIWIRKHLIWMLAVRDIRLRYKQSMFGILWAVIRPLVLMIAFTYLFGSVANLPSSGVPYPVFVFSGLLAWDLFANIVQGSASSITAHKVVVEQLYCPRLIFPLSSIIVALFDFLVGFFIYVVIAGCYGIYPSYNFLYMPLLLLLVILTALSVGLWLAAIAVWLRDIKFMVSYFLQLMLLLTPVGYASEAVPKNYSFLVDFNPMASVIDLFRWALIESSLQIDHLLYSMAAVIILFVCGLMFFNSLERSFADVI